MSVRYSKPHANIFADFGPEARGINPGTLHARQFAEVQEVLYKHNALLFRDITLTPEQQSALTKAFDPQSESYGHGNNKTDGIKKSIFHPDLKTIPRVPQVQLIGNGNVFNHEGLAKANLSTLATLPSTRFACHQRTRHKA
ncbi:hypothetical protein H0H87_000311 [Tephrocybe sp. NHM501043]|nr:hypothetical protein H0H87_000311 [Tephrocybe sp. NHM501043]